MQLKNKNPPQIWYTPNPQNHPNPHTPNHLQNRVIIPTESLEGVIAVTPFFIDIQLFTLIVKKLQI